MIPAYIIIFFGVVFFCLSMWVFSKRAVGRKLNRLQNNDLLPTDLQNPTDDEIIRLAKAGEKILAIKLYRQAHSVGLAEAKNAVEKMAIS